MKKLLAVIALASSCFAANSSSAYAFDPFGFYNYGMALSPAYAFRNRLPTPPYFAIYSPVYYGQQYERPYGISPFAAMPEVHVPATYVGQPRATASTIPNPYCLTEEAILPQSTHIEFETPIAATGKQTWIENPYVGATSKVVSK